MAFATSPATTGMSKANGTISANAMRKVLAKELASPGRSPSAARPDSRGRIAVARDTVTIEWGTMTIRNAVE